MSWKQRAIVECSRYLIEIDDQSSLTEYRIVMQAPSGHLLWGSETPEHTVVRPRKGNTKAKIWYDVYNDAICGTICGPSCNHRKP